MAISETESFNPYAAPSTGVEDADPFQMGDRQVRQRFIDCEANIRTIGGLTVLGGVLVTIVSGFMEFQSIAVLTPAGIVLYGALCSGGIGQVAVGIALARLQPWSRPAAIAVSAFWMLAFPVGTVLGGVSLFYLVRPVARYVFTPEYQEIIRKTPGTRVRTSPISWSLLACVVFIVVAWIALAILTWNRNSVYPSRMVAPRPITTYRTVGNKEIVPAALELARNRFPA